MKAKSKKGKTPKSCRGKKSGCVLISFETMQTKIHEKIKMAA